MGKTSIQWTDETWNPVTGCTKVSPGCKHCYAETVADRFWATQYPFVTVGHSGNPDTSDDTIERPRRFTDVWCHEDRLNQPLRWKRPRRIFVNSMSDLFHESVPDAFIDRVFAVMALAPQHTFQILTKRAERMRAYFGFHEDEPLDIRDRIDCAAGDHGACHANLDDRWPLPNVWLGVSVENQHFADERIPLLLQTPSAVRFVSYEPALGPVDFSHFLTAGDSDNPTRALNTHGQTGTCLEHGSQLSSGKGHAGISPQASGQRDQEAERPVVRTLDWVIIGGESGREARPFDVAWARSTLLHCRSAGVQCFVKQLGSNPTNSAQPDGDLVKASLTGKADNPAEWPEDLRVREYPSSSRRLTTVT